MKARIKLNPMVFVRDENDPAFRAHLISRAKEATDPKNRSKNLSVADAKKQLLKYRQKLIVHEQV